MESLWKPTVILSVTLLIGYTVLTATYRLYFHPLAKFPGPKLAALTRWYEFYYDVVCKGQFTFKTQALHQQYGPIVRIAPDEVHIEDSDYWGTLYSQSSKYEKYEWMAGRFGNNSSIFTTSNHDLHRLRRAPLNSLFSKRSIVNFQPVIREKIEILCENIARFGEGGKVVDMKKAWSAFAGDVVCQYAFGYSYNHLQSKDFDEGFHDAFMAASEFGLVAMQLPWLDRVTELFHFCCFIFRWLLQSDDSQLLKSLPDKYVDSMNPALHMLFVLQKDLRGKIASIAKGNRSKAKHRTIFEEVLDSDLPPEQKLPERLGDEAQTVIGAGLVTTAWALAHATFYILNQPETLQKLQDELRRAIPNAKTPVEWTKLEELPYLGGCVRESIRLSYGVTARLPRISRDGPMKYKSWEIPAGTPVSMTIVDVHNDENVYPDSNKFLPERWMNGARAQNGEPLERYLVAFNKGPRQCLGINLAHAELYMGIASLFRRFDLELYDTDVSDVLLVHDFFLPSPKTDSKGVRVLVKSVET